MSNNLKTEIDLKDGRKLDSCGFGFTLTQRKYRTYRVR